MDSITATLQLLREIGAHLAEHPNCIAVESSWDRAASRVLGYAVFRMRAYYRPHTTFFAFDLTRIATLVRARTDMTATYGWYDTTRADAQCAAVWTFSGKKP